MEMESNLMKAYLAAYEAARSKLRRMDPAEIARNTGAAYGASTNTLTLRHLNACYTIDCSTGEVVPEDAAVEVTATGKVLILHYLVHSAIRPLSGRLASFKEIPGGGAIYYQTFYKRAVMPLVKTFSEDLKSFRSAAAQLGARKEKFGHASATLDIFPLVPATYILWQGDDEVAPAGTILFDETVTGFLPVEDIVLAASFGSYALIAQGRGNRS